MHYKLTQYGFEWGPTVIQRITSDDKKGWVVFELRTPKYPAGQGLQIYVTKTGKVRIADKDGEWTSPRG